MIKKVLIGSSLTGVAGLYTTIYLNSDSLSQSHSRVAKATVRATRLFFTGARMASIYTVSKLTLFYSGAFLG